MIDIEVPEPMKGSGAAITFQVEKKWLDSGHFDKEDVELYHGGRNDFGEGLRARWMTTTTKGDYEQYYADTPTCSIFKIDAKKEEPNWAVVLAIVAIAVYIIFEIEQRLKKNGKNNTSESGGKAKEENVGNKSEKKKIGKEKNKEEKSKRTAEEKSSENDKRT